MKEFNFRIDRLLSVWETETVCVKAENLEEAKKELLNYETFEDSDNLEYLFDTAEVITPGTVFENTTEVFLETDEETIYLEGVDSL